MTENTNAAQDVRTWSDEDLDETAQFLARAGYADGEAYERVAAELARRAEIRIARGEFGGAHDADWYASRQTEDQWLDEAGAVDEPRFWSAR